MLQSTAPVSSVSPILPVLATTPGRDAAAFAQSLETMLDAAMPAGQPVAVAGNTLPPVAAAAMPVDATPLADPLATALVPIARKLAVTPASDTLADAPPAEVVVTSPDTMPAPDVVKPEVPQLPLASSRVPARTDLQRRSTPTAMPAEDDPDAVEDDTQPCDPPTLPNPIVAPSVPVAMPVHASASLGALATALAATDDPTSDSLGRRSADPPAPAALPGSPTPLPAPTPVLYAADPGASVPLPAVPHDAVVEAVKARSAPAGASAEAPSGSAPAITTGTDIRRPAQQPPEMRVDDDARAGDAEPPASPALDHAGDGDATPRLVPASIVPVMQEVRPDGVAGLEPAAASLAPVAAGAASAPVRTEAPATRADLPRRIGQPADAPATAPALLARPVVTPASVAPSQRPAPPIEQPAASPVGPAEPIVTTPSPLRTDGVRQPTPADAAPVVVAPSSPGAARTAEAGRTVSQAEPPILTRVALPATEPAPIAAGTTAPAFRVFAAAIHAARSEASDQEVPAAVTPQAPVEQLRAPAVATETQGAPLDMTDRRWPHAMVERIERLRDAASAAADAASTSIRLAPDALGTIDVSVRRDGDTVHVHFAAEQAATRTLLADAQPRLAELAETRGIRLAQGDVGAGGDGQRQPVPQPQTLSRAPASGLRDEDPETPTTTRIA